MKSAPSRALAPVSGTVTSTMLDTTPRESRTTGRLPTVTVFSSVKIGVKAREGLQMNRGQVPLGVVQTPT